MNIDQKLKVSYLIIIMMIISLFSAIFVSYDLSTSIMILAILLILELAYNSKFDNIPDVLTIKNTLNKILYIPCLSFGSIFGGLYLLLIISPGQYTGQLINILGISIILLTFLFVIFTISKNYISFPNKVIFVVKIGIPLILLSNLIFVIGCIDIIIS